MKKLSSTQWIVISMIVGIALGYFFPAAAYPGIATVEKAASSVFLRMIKSLIVPLIFGTLVVGIAGHGDDMKRVGRLALRSVVYFEIVTTIALAIGLVAVNVVKPGAGVSIAAASADKGTELAKTEISFTSMVEHTVPQSFFESAASNQVLQVVFFAILFAVALARVQGRQKQVMLDFCDSLAEVMFKFTAIVMGFAPWGIGAAIAMTVSTSGLSVLRNLAVLVFTLYGACLACILLVYLPIALMARIPVRAFWNAVKEPSLIAFSTASGEAALPLAMERLEEFGLPKRIIAFVLPTGYSFNLAGSTLYLAVASVFAAQAAGINMPISQQILMMLTLMLTSKGVAAVPRAALVILSGALTMFGLPLQVVAVLLGVDALLDMARTVVNLLGNCLATAVMARWEGEFPDQVGGTAI
jgi:proton glutamate symport protein